MSKVKGKISLYFLEFVLLLVLAGINWYWPLTNLFGDTTIFRFIWLGIFFIILDVELEILILTGRQLKIMSEHMTFAGELKKISEGFHVVTRVSLPNNSKADYVVVGSSGVWLLVMQGGSGKVTFNGDSIVQGEEVLRGLLSKALEESYSLASVFKEKLKKDIKVAPVIAFSSSTANFESVPKSVRGVYITSRQDAVSLIENTDAQIIDKNTIEEVYKIIKK